MPFCGILNVGGIATQQGDEDDDTPGLSSQGSTASGLSVASFSNFSNFSGANKRRFEGADEDDYGTPAPLETKLNSENRDMIKEVGYRPIAVPRRKRGENGATKVAVAGKARDNTLMDCGFDFEDAEFLDYDLEEVEMSGL